MSIVRSIIQNFQTVTTYTNVPISLYIAKQPGNKAIGYNSPGYYDVLIYNNTDGNTVRIKATMTKFDKSIVAVNNA
jgi:hypothetical protein